jgi:U3 small nucleolar RNA-associated protein 13
VNAVTLSQRISSYRSNAAIFVSGGGDKVLKRWNIPTTEKILRKSSHSTSGVIAELIATHSIRAHEKDINALAVSPNDAIIASGSQDSSIRLWSSQDLSSVATLTGHKRGIWCVRFSPVDRCLASSSGDRTVKLWSLTDYSLLRTFQGHTASVLSLQFVRYGMQILSAAADGLIHLWTIRTGESEVILDKHTEKIWALEKITLNDSELLLSAGSDASILCWYDATPEEEMNRLQSLENNLILEQKLANDIRLKRYAEVGI